MIIGTRRNFNPRRSYEETYSAYRDNGSGHGPRSVLVILDGDEQEQAEVIEQMQQGLACVHCGEILPFPTGIRYVKAYRDAWADSRPSFVMDMVLRNVAKGCCPMCGGELRGEMFDIQYRGVQE